MPHHRQTHTYVRWPWFDLVKRLVKCECSFNVQSMIGPLRGNMNRHCEEPGYSFQTLEGRLPIDYYAAILNNDWFHILT